MTGREWGWRPAQAEGIWRHGERWTKPLFAAAPWITLALLLVMFGLIDGRLTAAPGVEFDLPKSTGRQAVVPGATMLVLPSANVGENGGTLAFFDDARYLLSDPASVDEFAGRLSDRSVETRCGTLTLMADRRVPVGDVMQVMAVARSRRIAHVQLAEKND